MKTRLLSPNEIDAYLKRCIGKRVASVWKGYGTAIFLELGRLHRVPPFKGKKMRSHGDVTVMIEWSWRIESARSILVGSFDSEHQIDTKPQILKGQTVADITVACRLPELNIAFSERKWLHSFATEAGQSEWSLIFHGEGSMVVRRGRIYIENMEEGN